jgi:hypothetical protein
MANNGTGRSITSGHFNFLVLLLTTPASVFLFYCNLTDARFPGDFVDLILDNRPSVQFAVQIMANALAVAQIMVLCRLVNFAVRRRFARESMELDVMTFWTDAMLPHMNWGLPARLWIPLLLFLASTMALRGIWAAALTPVLLWRETKSEVLVPDWSNVTYVKEYPSEIEAAGPAMQNLKGRFSYSVGIHLLGSLLAKAASASTIDGRPVQHGKMDNSRYTYVGRSYGMGSSAGLVIDHLDEDSHARSYSYMEDGYKTNVDCIYNETSAFEIGPEDRWVFAAQGELPDSDNGPEYSNYLGHDGENIVAIGVAHFKDENAEELPLRRFLAFATGENYDFLHQVQCELNFNPARFVVTVNVDGRNITVASTDAETEDINPGRNLKSTVIRQFELIANDETNIYVSTVGAAFNASITDLRTYAATSGDGETDESTLVLQAVRNSVIAMTDDMLGAYAAAQIVVGGFTQNTTATLRIDAIAIGEFRFAVAVFAVNTVIIFVFLEEAIRTKWWKGLPVLDIADLRQMAVAASAGGKELGDLGRGKSVGKIGQMRIRYDGYADGSYAILAGNTCEEDEEKTPIAMEAMSIDGARRQSWEDVTDGGWI